MSRFMCKWTWLLAMAFSLTGFTAKDQGQCPNGSFSGLGVLAAPCCGNEFPSTFVEDMSDDGSVVVGTYGWPDLTMFEQDGFRWSAKGGLEALHLTFDPLVLPANAKAVSGDGQMIIGRRRDNYTLDFQLYRWTERTGVQPIDNPEKFNHIAVYDADASGETVIAMAWPGSVPLRWSDKTGFMELLPLAGDHRARVFSVSGDGSRMVGFSAAEPPATRFHAVVWENGDPLPTALVEPDGYPNSTAELISADGNVIVGISSTPEVKGVMITRWPRGKSPEILGALEGFPNIGSLGVSGDGSLIVGACGNDFGGSAAFIWTPQRGMRHLHNVLIDAGLNLNGWTLTSPRRVAVANSTLIIIGDGIHEWRPGQFRPEPWMARVPLQANPADINCDGAVNANDLLAVINSWGPCPAPPQACPADIAPPGGDGAVNVEDLLFVINHWG